MSELMDRILAGKRASRKQLAALPFAWKLELVEKMRDRSLLIAASSLRRQRQTGPEIREPNPRNPTPINWAIKHGTDGPFYETKQDATFHTQHPWFPPQRRTLIVKLTVCAGGTLC